MLPIRSSLLMFIVAIQFSQILAAPREEDGRNVEDFLPSAAQSGGEQVDQTVKDSMQSAADQVESMANGLPSVEDKNVPSEEKPEEHLSHMLTKEQELKLLHQVPEFTSIIQAMERLPDGVYDELKAFLESTVPRMPKDNLFTQHFLNAKILVDIFERLIKAARSGGAQRENKALFHQVHKAAPLMKAEMNEFNVLMGQAKSRLASLGTSINPMDSVAQPLTAGVNVAAGQVSLPVGETPENSAGELEPPQVPTGTE